MVFWGEIFVFLLEAILFSRQILVAYAKNALYYLNSNKKIGCNAANESLSQCVQALLNSIFLQLVDEVINMHHYRFYILRKVILS